MAGGGQEVKVGLSEAHVERKEKRRQRRREQKGLKEGELDLEMQPIGPPSEQEQTMLLQLRANKAEEVPPLFPFQPFAFFMLFF